MVLVHDRVPGELIFVSESVFEKFQFKISQKKGKVEKDGSTFVFDWVLISFVY